jgi:hypothetical protein
MSLLTRLKYSQALEPLLKPAKALIASVICPQFKALFSKALDIIAQSRAKILVFGGFSRLASPLFGLDFLGVSLY